MKLFTSTTFTWWQVGLLKWAVLLIGIFIGTTWHEVLSPYAAPCLVVGLVLSLYLGSVWYRVHK